MGWAEDFVYSRFEMYVFLLGVAGGTVAGAVLEWIRKNRL